MWRVAVGAAAKRSTSTPEGRTRMRSCSTPSTRRQAAARSVVAKKRSARCERAPPVGARADVAIRLAAGDRLGRRQHELESELVLQRGGLRGEPRAELLGVHDVEAFEGGPRTQVAVAGQAQQQVSDPARRQQVAHGASRGARSVAARSCRSSARRSAGTSRRSGRRAPPTGAAPTCSTCGRGRRARAGVRRPRVVPPPPVAVAGRPASRSSAADPSRLCAAVGRLAARGR